MLQRFGTCSATTDHFNIDQKVSAWTISFHWFCYGWPVIPLVRPRWYMWQASSAYCCMPISSPGTGFTEHHSSSAVSSSVLYVTVSILHHRKNFSPHEGAPYVPFASFENRILP